MVWTAEQLIQAGRFPAEACSISPQTSVLDALQVMEDEGMSALAIVDESGRLVGTYSARDYARSVAHEAPHATTARVAQVMRPGTVRGVPQVSLAVCVETMDEHDLWHLPITEGDRLVGLLYKEDALRALLVLARLDLERLTPRARTPRAAAFPVAPDRSPW